MRLIDADEFRRHIDSHYPFNKEEQSRNVIADIAKSNLLLVLSNEPTVEAEPVRHGHWIGLTDSNFTCSECKETIYTWIGRRNNYCPNCGAKMDEGE